MPTPSPTSPEAFSRKGWCATFLDRWRVERALRVLQALEPLDRRTVLHDVGLTEGDLDAVAHADHVDCLLPAALALHGIDGAALEAGQPALMQDLMRVCMHCRGTRACSRMLADGTDVAAHGRLCPNAATLETLR